MFMMKGPSFGCRQSDEQATRKETRSCKDCTGSKRAADRQEVGCGVEVDERENGQKRGKAEGRREHKIRQLQSTSACLIIRGELGLTFPAMDIDACPLTSASEASEAKARMGGVVDVNGQSACELGQRSTSGRAVGFYSPHSKLPSSPAFIRFHSRLRPCPNLKPVHPTPRSTRKVPCRWTSRQGR
jgi:hypothetical protein